MIFAIVYHGLISSNDIAHPLTRRKTSHCDCHSHTTATARTMNTVLPFVVVFGCAKAGFSRLRHICDATVLIGVGLSSYGLPVLCDVQIVYIILEVWYGSE